MTGPFLPLSLLPTRIVELGRSKDQNQQRPFPLQLLPYWPSVPRSSSGTPSASLPSRTLPALTTASHAGPGSLSKLFNRSAVSDTHEEGVSSTVKTRCPICTPLHIPNGNHHTSVLNLQELSLNLRPVNRAPGSIRRFCSQPQDQIAQGERGAGVVVLTKCLLCWEHSATPDGGTPRTADESM